MNKRDRIGAENPLFRGGKTVVNGYVVLCSKTWGKDWGRREHCVVMESVLGRSLRRGELVHHRNGDGTDNRPENLELVTRPTHNRKHGRGQLLRCAKCGKERWYSPSELAKMRYDSFGYLCRRCALSHLYTKTCQKCGASFQGGMPARYCGKCSPKARGKRRQRLATLQP